MKCELKKGELIKIDLSDGEKLFRCLGGALWITTGNGIDYLLSENIALGNLSGKNAIVEALQDSELQIEFTAKVQFVSCLTSDKLRFMAGA